LQFIAIRQSALHLTKAALSGQCLSITQILSLSLSLPRTLSLALTLSHALSLIHIWGRFADCITNVHVLKCAHFSSFLSSLKSFAKVLNKTRSKVFNCRRSVTGWTTLIVQQNLLLTCFSITFLHCSLFCFVSMFAEHSFSLSLSLFGPFRVARVRQTQNSLEQHKSYKWTPLSLSLSFFPSVPLTILLTTPWHLSSC